MKHAVAQATITHRAALRCVDASLSHAESLGIQICVVIVDGAGRSVASARMPGAFLIANDIAFKKAYSTAAVGAPAELAEQLLAQEAPRVREGVLQTGFTLIRGGLPLREGDVLIGAVGISGGSEAQDIECAQAAVAALQG